MSKITWDETFSVHNAELDEQHRKWIAIINELHEVLAYGDLDKLQTISAQTLDAMMRYVRYHFSTEEDFMLAINYPEYAGHKKIHDKFYVHIKGLHSDVKEGIKVLNSEIMKTLTNWLQTHILEEDMKYRRFADSRGIPGPGH